MTVLNNPGPYPGADAIVEGVDGTVQISGADTTGTVNLTLEGNYSEVADIWHGLSAESTSASTGAAAADIDRIEVTNRTATQIDVEVELSTAPGSGETRTVEVRGVIVGLSA